MNKRSKQTGFTLIEILVVLVIGIIIIAAAAASFGKTFSSNDVATEARNITEVIANARTLKEASGYPTDLVPSLKATGGLPSSYSVGAAGAVSHTWGGAVTVPGSGRTYSVNYAAVPADACVKLAPKVAGTGAVKVSVNGTNLDPNGTDTLTVQADTACTDAATGNAIVFAG